MKYLIFDFDGTLANSLPLIIDIADELLGERISLSDMEIEELRNMPAKEIIKRSGVSYLKIPRLLLKGRALFAKRLDKLTVFKGLVNVVAELHDNGHTLFVVSSNSEANIRTVLRKEGIEGYFSAIYGNVGLFSKAASLKKVLKEQSIPRKDCFYIGDEVRDIEAAKKVRVPIVSVAWGFNGEKILLSYKPNYLVKTPKELRQVLES